MNSSLLGHTISRNKMRQSLSKSKANARKVMLLINEKKVKILLPKRILTMDYFLGRGMLYHLRNKQVRCIFMGFTEFEVILNHVLKFLFTQNTNSLIAGCVASVQEKKLPCANVN